MSRYAITKFGKVVNIIEWDGDASVWSPEEGCDSVEIKDGEMVNIGMSYAAGKFGEPKEIEK